jgi:CheY-like chemotaxis protein
MTKPKILIVDDEIDQCFIIKSYFQSRNYDVFMEQSLKEGIESLKKNNPDILLLDNNLPDGKGWDMVDALVEDFPELKIHLISAYHQKKDSLPKHLNVTVWEKPISLTVLDKAFRE